MLALYKRWKKHTEIKLTKNKMDLNNRFFLSIYPSIQYTYNTSTTPCGNSDKNVLNRKLI